MRCPDCGHENPPTEFRCDCGRHLTVPDFGRELSAPPPEQRDIDKTDTRPLAGIAVAAVFGGISIVWSCINLSSTLAGTNQADRTITAVFPDLQMLAIFAEALGITGNSVILVGAFLAFMRQPNGARVVRITSWFMLLFVFVFIGISWNSAINSPLWQTVGEPFKAGFIGGLIGGAIANVIWWGLLLFLFRERRPSKLKVQSAGVSSAG